LESDGWVDLGRRVVEDWNGGDLDLLQSYLEDRQSLEITVEDGRVDNIDVGRKSGIGLTATRGRNTHFACFSSRETCRTESQQMVEPLGVDSTSPVGWSEPEKRSFEVDERPTMRPEEPKIDRLMEADRSARSIDDRVEQVKISYSEKSRFVTILDREGWIRREPRVLTNLNVTVIGREGDLREKGYGRLAGYTGETLFERESAEEVAEKAARQAMTALEAEPVEAGPRTVVIGSGFGGTIFHEACGHGFEADHIFEEVSAYAGRRGEQVASELVTFVDDGSIPGRYGSFRFDDEGTPSSRNVLIEDGVMRSMMTDRKHAELLDIEPSGNGRRQSYQHRVLPRMTNTFIEAGETDPDAIIEDTEDGIYAHEIGGGQVDPASGDFIFSITEGYRIEDGNVTHPIRDAALVGNGPEVLNRIDAVGNDLELTPGVCGKGQWVPVCVGQPTLRVRDLTVGGDE
jgi:TldD protein